MKIISDFHDYYDVMRRIDTDKMHIYKRKTEEFEIDNRRYMCGDKYKRDLRDIRLFSYELRSGRWSSGVMLHRHEMFIIGFCGKFYYGIKHFNPQLTSISYGKNEFEIIDLFNACFERYEEKESQISSYIKNIKQTISNENTKLFSDLFEKYKTPVFVIENIYPSKIGIHHRIIINPCLKDYEFYQVFVPYNAYQEIQMYVGNNLVDDPNKAWPIDDKLKVQSHGFDKFSFRKDKINK
jgi:hypothetical protein